MNALVAEGLSKCYWIPRSTNEKGRRSLRERLLSPLTGGSQPSTTELWALRDVGFQVEPGTILGVIGPNGAGKSTLLKIIARVIAPTAGRVVGVGRVVSLLEMGAGFHPDLTARENILMNAALLGVPRHEALRRVDDIIEFAEVERFVESPLKHYSSGMYLRLAFALAIKMNPHILLADEILAVGDATFQERCLQTVEEGGRRGLTVLFVSHDMDAITRVCNRVMWLSGGQVVKDGDPEEVVDDYQNAIWSQADETRTEKGRLANRFGEILTVRLVSSEGKEIGGIPIDEDVFVRIRIRTLRPRLLSRCGVDMNTRNQLLFRSVDTEFRPMPVPGVYQALMRIPANLLAESTYWMTISCILTREPTLKDTKEYPLVIYNALNFIAYASERSVTTGRLRRAPLIAPKLDWTAQAETDATSV